MRPCWLLCSAAGIWCEKAFGGTSSYVMMYGWWTLVQNTWHCHSWHPAVRDAATDCPHYWEMCSVRLGFWCKARKIASLLFPQTMRDWQIQYVSLLSKWNLKKEEANPDLFKAGNKMTESKNDCDYSSVFFFLMQLKCKHGVDFCFKQNSVLNWSHQAFYQLKYCYGETATQYNTVETWFMQITLWNWPPTFA